MKTTAVYALGAVLLAALPASGQAVAFTEIGTGPAGANTHGVAPGTYVVRDARTLLTSGIEQLVHTTAPIQFSHYTLLAVVKPDGENARMLSVQRLPLPAPLSGLIWSGSQPAQDYLRVDLAGPAGRPFQYHVILIPATRAPVKFERLGAVALPIPNPPGPSPASVDIERLRVETWNGERIVILQSPSGKTYSLPRGGTSQAHYENMLLELGQAGALPLTLIGDVTPLGMLALPTDFKISVSKIQKTIRVSAITIVPWNDDQVVLNGAGSAVYVVPLTDPHTAELRQRRGQTGVTVEALIIPSGPLGPTFTIKVLSVQVARRPLAPRAGVIQRMDPK